MSHTFMVSHTFMMNESYLIIQFQWRHRGKFVSAIELIEEYFRIADRDDTTEAAVPTLDMMLIDLETEIEWVIPYES